MIKRIVIAPRASLDIDEQFIYIAGDNVDVAMSFFDAARETFSQLARTPGIGSLYNLANPRLLGLRKWALKGFEKYLIFYLERDDSIKIVRILHAARDRKGDFGTGGIINVSCVGSRQPFSASHPTHNYEKR